MSRKIIPGCLARVIRGHDAGVVVTALNLVVNDDFAASDKVWRIDELVKASYPNEGKLTDLIGEEQLHRIDDNDLRKVSSWDKLKGIFEPEDLKVNS